MLIKLIWCLSLSSVIKILGIATRDKSVCSKCEAELNSIQKNQLNINLSSHLAYVVSFINGCTSLNGLAVIFGVNCFSRKIGRLTGGIWLYCQRILRIIIIHYASLCEWI